jgi:hypothetical protein
MARRNSRHSEGILRVEKGFFYSFNVEVQGRDAASSRRVPWNDRFGLWRTLSTRNSQYCLGICARDSQQSPGSAARLFAALLPSLQGANRHANERCKLGLGQTSFLSRLNDGRRNNMNLTGLHFAH